jgi:hypothetical protein
LADDIFRRGAGIVRETHTVEFIDICESCVEECYDGDDDDRDEYAEMLTDYGQTEDYEEQFKKRYGPVTKWDDFIGFIEEHKLTGIYWMTVRLSNDGDNLYYRRYKIRMVNGNITRVHIIIDSFVEPTKTFCSCRIKKMRITELTSDEIDYLFHRLALSQAHTIWYFWFITLANTRN